MMDIREIKKRFTYHHPGDLVAALADRIRVKAFRFAELLITMVPESRELSIAIRKLEEVVFWATAALIREESDRQNFEAKER